MFNELIDYSLFCSSSVLFSPLRFLSSIIDSKVLYFSTLFSGLWSPVINILVILVLNSFPEVSFI